MTGPNGRRRTTFHTDTIGRAAGPVARRRGAAATEAADADALADALTTSGALAPVANARRANAAAARMVNMFFFVVMHMRGLSALIRVCGRGLAGLAADVLEEVIAVGTGVILAVAVLLRGTAAAVAIAVLLIVHVLAVVAAAAAARCTGGRGAGAAPPRRDQAGSTHPAARRGRCTGDIMMGCGQCRGRHWHGSTQRRQGDLGLDADTRPCRRLPRTASIYTLVPLFGADCPCTTVCTP
jgi:hypothetical protein